MITNYLNKNENSLELERAFNKDRRFNSPLSCIVVDNGIVLPYYSLCGKILGGVIDSTGHFIKQTSFNSEIGGIYNFKNKNIIKKNEIAVYLGFFPYSAWGHFFTDYFKHLWWLLTNEFKELSSYSNISYIAVSSPTFNKLNVIEEIMNMINSKCCNSKIERVVKITQYNKILIPMPSFYPSWNFRINHIIFWTNEYKSTIDQFIHSVKYDKGIRIYDKIYLSRTKLKGHRDYGEKTIEKAFARRGYKIIYPELVPLNKQLFYFQHARIMAATEGSISHNAIFLRDGQTVIILRKSSYINPYQLAIDEIRNLNVIYVDCHFSIMNNKKHPQYGPFFIYLNKNLARLLGTKIKLNLYEFIKYVTISFISKIHVKLLNLRHV